MPAVRTPIARRTFSHAASSVWNNLPVDIRRSGSTCYSDTRYSDNRVRASVKLRVRVRVENRVRVKVRVRVEIRVRVTVRFRVGVGVEVRVRI